jgi:uncharacterized peroxidase-related enzyme
MKFDLHTPKTAPEGSRFVLESAEKKNGFVPNLLAVFAESPAALQAYSNLTGALQHNTDFSAAELQILFLAISAENGCEYCMAAHSTIAANGVLGDRQLAALREGTPLPDEKQEALRNFAIAIVRKRGWADDADVTAFAQAGFSRRQVLDVLAAVTLKTLTNYLNHLGETPVDEAFQQQAWKAPARV